MTLNKCCRLVCFPTQVTEYTLAVVRLLRSAFFYVLTTKHLHYQLGSNKDKITKRFLTYQNCDLNSEQSRNGFFPKSFPLLIAILKVCNVQRCYTNISLVSVLYNHINVKLGEYMKFSDFLQVLLL